MRAVRFGSYSIACTFAAMPCFWRLKSMSRYFCLWPPPMKREVTRPIELRPPVFGLPFVSDFSGLLFVISLNDDVVRSRRPGDVGLYDFVAMVIRLLR